MDSGGCKRLKSVSSLLSYCHHLYKWKHISSNICQFSPSCWIAAWEGYCPHRHSSLCTISKASSIPSGGMWKDCGRVPKYCSFSPLQSESSDICFLLVITHRLFHLHGRRFVPAVETEVGKVLKQRLKPKRHNLSSSDAQKLQWSRFRLRLFKRKSGSIIWDLAVFFSQPYCSFTSAYFTLLHKLCCKMPIFSYDFHEPSSSPKLIWMANFYANCIKEINLGPLETIPGLPDTISMVVWKHWKSVWTTRL